MESKTKAKEKAESEHDKNEDIKNEGVKVELKQEFVNESTDIKIELKNELDENFIDTTREYLKDEKTAKDIKQYASVKIKIGDGENIDVELLNKQIKVEQTSDIFVSYERHHYNDIEINNQCEYKTKHKINLQSHGVVWYTCDQCEYKSLMKYA